MAAPSGLTRFTAPVAWDPARTPDVSTLRPDCFASALQRGNLAYCYTKVKVGQNQIESQQTVKNSRFKDPTLLKEQ